MAIQGLAAPLLIAGIATSSVGAATNIGTSLIERIINSKQVSHGQKINNNKVSVGTKLVLI